MLWLIIKTSEKKPQKIERQTTDRNRKHQKKGPPLQIFTQHKREPPHSRQPSPHQAETPPQPHQHSQAHPPRTPAPPHPHHHHHHHPLPAKHHDCNHPAPP